MFNEPCSYLHFSTTRYQDIKPNWHSNLFVCFSAQTWWYSTFLDWDFGKFLQPLTVCDLIISIMIIENNGTLQSYMSILSPFVCSVALKQQHICQVANYPCTLQFRHSELNMLHFPQSVIFPVYVVLKPGLALERVIYHFILDLMCWNSLEHFFPDTRSCTRLWVMGLFLLSIFFSNLLLEI